MYINQSKENTQTKGRIHSIIKKTVFFDLGTVWVKNKDKNCLLQAAPYNEDNDKVTHSLDFFLANIIAAITSEALLANGVTTKP